VYEAFSEEVPTERIVRFTSGMKVEAVDTTHAWYRAEVLNVDHKKQEVLVHFVGYDHRFDQIMSFDSPLIRPAGKLESLARSLRTLDRGRTKALNPARRREASPPWRLPGMDVDPTSRRVRRPVDKFTVGSTPTALPTEPQAPATPVHLVGTPSRRSSGGGGGGGGADAAVTAKKRRVSKAGKSVSTSLGSAARRIALGQSSSKPPPSPRRRAEGVAPSAAARSTSRPSPARQPAKRPQPTLSLGAASRKHPPPKLRISLQAARQVPSSSCATCDGGGGGSAGAPLSAARSTSGGSSAMHDDSFIFQFPASPKVATVEVKEIITPEFRAVRSPLGLATLASAPSPLFTPAAAGAAEATATCVDHGAFGAASAATPLSLMADCVEEDMSDATFLARHQALETLEKTRLAPPNGEDGPLNNPASPYAVIAVPQRQSANADSIRWAGVEPFPARIFHPSRTSVVCAPARDEVEAVPPPPVFLHPVSPSTEAPNMVTDIAPTLTIV
jgi:hypothetical protein